MISISHLWLALGRVVAFCLYTALIFALVVAMLRSAGLGVPMGSFVLGYCGALVLGIFAHELGHAVAGYLVNVRPRLIRVGGRPALFRLRLWDTAIEINADPSSGEVAYYPKVDNAPWRAAVYTLGGVFGNLALILLLLAVWQSETLPQWIRDIIAIIIFLQGWVICLNIVPWQHLTRSMPIFDGDLLVRALCGECDEARPVYDEVTARYRLPGAPVHPPSPAAGFVVYYAREPMDHSDRRSALIEELARKRMSLAEEMSVLDSLLTAGLMTVNSETPADMDRWSERLFQLGSALPTVRGTRGAILVQTDRLEEGRALLAPLLDDPGAGPFDRFMSNLYLAWAALKAGRLDDARIFYGQARKCCEDPGVRWDVTPLLDALKQAIDQHSGAQASPPSPVESDRV